MENREIQPGSYFPFASVVFPLAFSCAIIYYAS